MIKKSAKYNKTKSGKKTLKGWQLTPGDGRSVFLSAKNWSERAVDDCRDALALIERDLNGGGQWSAGRFSDHTQKTLDRLREDRPKLFALLQDKGFIPGGASITIGELYREYVNAAKAGGQKAQTLNTKETTFKHVFEYWGRDRDAATLTPKDAQGYINWLSTQAAVRGREEQGYSQATKAADIKVLRAVWNWARKAGLLANDPFSEIKRPGFVNAERSYYVDGDKARRVLDACPSQEWRALFALYRFGGLRANEALILRWRDVDFEAGRLTIRSPKTERNGRGARVAPLFPRLRQELEAWRDEAEKQGLTADEDARVIARYSPGSNAGTSLKKIILKAGLTPWPRLLQNLRASAATDISQECGPINESAWLGHSPLVSLQHYQQSTQGAFKDALAKDIFG